MTPLEKQLLAQQSELIIKQKALIDELASEYTKAIDYIKSL